MIITCIKSDTKLYKAVWKESWLILGRSKCDKYVLVWWVQHYHRMIQQLYWGFGLASLSNHGWRHQRKGRLYCVACIALVSTPANNYCSIDAKATMLLGNLAVVTSLSRLSIAKTVLTFLIWNQCQNINSSTEQTKQKSRSWFEFLIKWRSNKDFISVQFLIMPQ